MAGQDPVMEKLWGDFLQMCTRCFLPIVQLYGHNLARQRDKHLPACLEDLSVLQSEVRVFVAVGTPIVFVGGENGVRYDLRSREC